LAKKLCETIAGTYFYTLHKKFCQCSKIITDRYQYCDINISADELRLHAVTSTEEIQALFVES